MKDGKTNGTGQVRCFFDFDAKNLTYPKQNGWLGGGLHDIFVEGSCQMFLPGMAGWNISNNKKPCQSRQLIWCLLSLEKVRVQQKNKQHVSDGMRLEGRLIGWSGWLLKTWVCNLVSPQIDRRAPPTWKICFSNYELFQETTTYSSKQSRFGIIDIPKMINHRSTWWRYDMYSPENQRMSLENQWMVQICFLLNWSFQGTFVSLF